MKYSIVIPTYNHCDDLLKPCIESLQKYTDFDDVELVVVANGCTDNTREYINSLKIPHQLIWYDQAIGYTRAANAGLRASQGQYIVLLNNDTEILPSDRNQWLNRLREPFDQNNRMAVTGSLQLFDRDVNSDFLVFCCVMISKSAINHLGYLDESFSPGYGEDIDFCMRVKDADWQWHCIDQTQYINGTNVGNFPLWHKGNKTFGEISEYSDVIVKRNQEILRNRYRNKKIDSSLQQAYNWCKNTSSDINELIPLLRHYARNCEHITELGTRYCVSTYGFLAGLPKKFISYDIVKPWNLSIAENIAKNNNIDFEFRLQDTRQAQLEETDLIFFDTLHEYQQVKTELELHADKSRKYLLFHDTTSFAEIGEAGGVGIWPAIQEFIDQHPEWQLRERFTHCNGLTVLERVDIKIAQRQPRYSIVIPTYNHCDDLLKPCVESIRKYTNLNDIELVIVANGCTDNTREYVESLGSWAKLIWHDQPLGYPRACNMGIRASQGEFVVLLNNDTELLPQVQNRWLDMLSKFFVDPTVGMVSPLEGYDAYTDTRVLIFFYVMIRRQVFDKIGYLDEVFSPGGCEDIDFTYRAKLAGFQCLQATDDVKYRPEASTNSGGVPIWHKDNRTFGEIKEYKRSILRKNNLINARRWNKNIKLSLGPNQFQYPSIAKEKYFSVVDQDTRADFWMPGQDLEFDDNSVNELLSVELLETLDKETRSNALKNWYRILKPQGKLVVEFLDMEKIINLYNRSTVDQKIKLANFIVDNRSGILAQQLIQFSNDLGFNEIVLSDPVYSDSKIYSRMTAVKQKRKSIDWEQIKQQDPAEYQELVVINGYGVVTEEIKNSTVIDIGGNIGMFSLLALEHQASKILAIEPQKTNFQQLKSNVQDYPEIVPINLAVYNQDNQTLNINDQGSCSSIYQGGDPVATIKLQTLLDQHQITSTDMIMKIDCEGAEYDILPDCSDQLLRRFKIIMMELHTDNHPIHKGTDLIYQKLQNAGFVKTRDIPMIMLATGQELGVYVQKWVRV